jgi:4-hydroxy-3-polyprenylbenzoate decarboxylase
MKRHIAVAITGASGTIYGIRLIEELLAAKKRVSLLISSSGRIVLKEELGLDWSGDEVAMNSTVRDHFKATADFLTPCSMGTLARIAAGLSGNLLERAADVMLKEGKPLLLLPRETPLSAIHLENMLKLARLGVRIIPPLPGFYSHPQTIDDIVNFVVGKVLDQLGIEGNLFQRWGDKNKP